MKILDITNVDFVNYKVPSVIVLFPNCSMKCGIDKCQNVCLLNKTSIEVTVQDIIDHYRSELSNAIVMSGLEPFDSFDDLLELCQEFRKEFALDDIVIYTGYNEDEIEPEITQLRPIGNITIKFGRYVPFTQPHIDPLLGVTLASPNQYAKKIC